jgi:hypothetical protein
LKHSGAQITHIKPDAQSVAPKIFQKRSALTRVNA